MKPRYRCSDCGAEFYKPERVEESRGEYWGAPCTETMYYCPWCGRNNFKRIEEDER